MVALMPRGGARPGAGRPAKAPEDRATVTVAVALTEGQAKLLATLQVERRQTASEVLRAGLMLVAAEH